jgi:hypothetical protein
MRAWGAVVAAVLGFLACGEAFAQSRLRNERLCQLDRTHPSCWQADTAPQGSAVSSNWQPQVVCERDPTRMSCESSGRGRTGPKATPSPIASTNSVVLNAPAPAFCERDPTRMSCETSGRGKTLGAGRTSSYTAYSALRDADRGSAFGYAGGLAVGLATCAPSGWIPHMYTVCVLGVASVGFLGGAVAGMISGDIAASAPTRAASAPVAPTTHIQETFEQALARAAGEKEHSAVAVAIGEGRMAWGVAGGMATQDEARWRALDYCNRHAAREAVHAACAIYQLDGQYTELVLK